MLTLSAVNAYYGKAHILFDLSMRVEDGQIVCLLGRNGVGKTTCLKTIMGLTSGTQGSILFEGRETVRLAPFQIARLGIGYVPEDRRIFPELTVRENLEVGEIKRGNGTRWTVQRAYEMFPALDQFQDHKGGLLSGGQQQMLTIARTLMGNPRMLLLDEPTEGLSPLVVRELEERILRLRGQVTMLVAAQDVRFAMKVADYAYVMDRGRIVYEGTVDQMRLNEAAVKGYLVI